jgi:hypothetical protein
MKEVDEMNIIEKIENNESSVLVLAGSDLEDLLSIWRKLKHKREWEAVRHLDQKAKIPK